MFVLVAMMVTASALLFPETALAKSKAVIAEQSSGFSVKVILDWILHLDKHLVELFATSGKMAYGALWDYLRGDWVRGDAIFTRGFFAVRVRRVRRNRGVELSVGVRVALPRGSFRGYGELHVRLVLRGSRD